MKSCKIHLQPLRGGSRRHAVDKGSRHEGQHPGCLLSCLGLAGRQVQEELGHSRGGRAPAGHSLCKWRQTWLETRFKILFMQPVPPCRSETDSSYCAANELGVVETLMTLQQAGSAHPCLLVSMVLQKGCSTHKGHSSDASSARMLEVLPDVHHLQAALPACGAGWAAGLAPLKRWGAHHSTRAA